MKQEFATRELMAVLEGPLGFRIRSLERLPGKAWSLNFKAVREADGFEFVVKLVPDTGNAAYEARFAQTVRHLGDLTGTKAARLLFPSCEISFRNYHVCFLTWCPGVRLFPDKLTVEQLKAFLDDYLAFSRGMQKTTGIFPKRDGTAVRKMVLNGLSGLLGKRLRCKIETDMSEADVTHRPELTQVIHGDFHYGNFLFEGGRLSGIFDLEEFRYGYPAEDIVRYVTCAVEHLRWYEWGRARGIKQMFAVMVRHLPYSAHEWIVALNVHFLLKVSKRVRSGIGFIKVLNLLFRYAFYRELKAVAREAEGLP
ncbi:MAG: aminoglycoside phosphotransferase family protein [Kiritimatiellae bacterium]|nr:aminoglycoside phosphotransferase family protein [Kiritimatiellia bacterium]MBR3688458.1 aminoglycoside phosphotransferase family protein [Lentisphaeria bacterium]